jgi:RNA polymerase subunit RPABC4/transcription elongation factor Spt4
MQSLAVSSDRTPLGRRLNSHRVLDATANGKVFESRLVYLRVERETVGPTQFLYWGQLVYGALVGVVGTFIYRRVTAGLVGPATIGAVFGLAFATIVFIAYLQNLHKGDLDPDYSRSCYACRLPVNRYSEFCEHCGADLIERSNYGACPNCQAELFEGTAFCSSCGEDLRSTGLESL